MSNEKTARNQIIGGVVMGISMGLFEETVYDARNGKPINNNYADYFVPVNADIPYLLSTILTMFSASFPHLPGTRYSKDSAPACSEAQ